MRNLHHHANALAERGVSGWTRCSKHIQETLANVASIGLLKMKLALRQELVSLFGFHNLIDFQRFFRRKVAMQKLFNWLHQSVFFIVVGIGLSLPAHWSFAGELHPSGARAHSLSSMPWSPKRQLVGIRCSRAVQLGASFFSKPTKTTAATISVIHLFNLALSQ